jgi:hypothetical protein
VGDNGDASDTGRDRCRESNQAGIELSTKSGDRLRVGQTALGAAYRWPSHEFKFPVAGELGPSPGPKVWLDEIAKANVLVTAEQVTDLDHMQIIGPHR